MALLLQLYNIIVLVSVITKINGYSSYVEQQFAMEPQDQVAVVGAKVILPCRVINKQGVLQWTKDDFGLGTRRKLAGFDRYSMIGSDDEGDYSLQIYPVTLDDNALFQCQVSSGVNGHTAIRSRYASLTILVSPDPPVITQGERVIATEDRIVSIECISPNGKPAAEITWTDGLGNVFTTGVEYIVEQTPDRKRFTAKSILKLKANKEHHNRTIICQAQNSVDIEYRTVQVRLEVKYSPKVIVAITEGALDTGRIPEGNMVEILCLAEANPNDLTYRWYLNDDVIGQNSRELTLVNVTRDYVGSMVKCVAQNSIGVSSDSHKLDIIYQPTFIKRPQNVEADDQETVYLECQIDANPAPEIVWVFDPIDRINLHPRVVGTTEKLEIVASVETAGRYFCKGNTIGYPEIRAEAKVILKGPPKIISPNEQFPLDDPNDANEIECSAISIPKAKHVSWAFNGRLIDFERDDGFTLREAFIPDGIKSTLTIDENRVDYMGKYSCIVINSYGSDTLEIIFSEPKKFSPIIAIAGSALIFVIIFSGAALIIFCVRTNKKSTLPPADIIPKENGNAKNTSLNRKVIAKAELPEHQEYQESNSGSYSTTTTLSINKQDLMPGKVPNLSIPLSIRYSGNFTDNLSIHTNQSMNGLTGGLGCVGSSSYVDYARDYYSPTIQNANNCLLQIQRETPTYV